MLPIMIVCMVAQIMAITVPQGQVNIELKKCQVQESDNLIAQIWDLLTADNDNFYSCRIKIEDVQNYINVPIPEQSDIFVSVANNTQLIVSGGTLHFNYDQTNCTQSAPPINLPQAENLTKCRYDVAVVSTHVNRTQFILTLKGVNTHVQLYEGLPVRSYVMQKDKDYYKFTLNNSQKDIIGIQFQFTVLNGDIIVYGSETEQFPTAINSTKSAVYNLDVIEFQQNGNKSMNGDYYLTVESQSLTSYTVTVILKKGGTQFQPTYILLYEGVPQEISVHSKNSIQYFKFKVRQTGNTSQIYINIDAIVGQAKAYIIGFKDGENKEPSSPSAQNSQWQLRTSQRSLIIDTKEINFVSQGEYRIAVHPLNEQVVYEIQYSSKWSIIPLHLGVPHFDSLSVGQMKYYELKFQKDLQELILTRTITTSGLESDDDVQIYVSLSSTYPSNSTNDMALRGQENKTLNLDFMALNKAGCNQNKSCTIYFAARTLGGFNDFTILLRGVHEPTQLLEDVSQVMSAPIKGTKESVFFYYQIPMNKTVRVQTYSIYQDLDIYANIVPYVDLLHYVHQLTNKDQLSKQEYQALQNQYEALFPTTKNSQIKSIDNNIYGASALIVTKTNLSHPNVTCNQQQLGCALLITVALDRTSYMYNYTYGQAHDGTFEIEASSDIETIRIGEPTIGFTQGGIMEYYKLVVRKPVGMIQISVSPLDDGDPDIYVKYQESNYTEDHYPSPKDSDFHAMAFKADILLIQKTDKFYNNHTIQGTYIIGILGFKQTKFSLEVTLADVQLYTIAAGQVMDKIQLKAADKKNDDYKNVNNEQYFQQIAFFKYNHVQNANFRVIISKTNGNGRVSLGINRHGNGSFWQTQSMSVFQSLPYYNHTKAKWHTSFKDRMFGGIVRVDKNNTDYSYYCTYVMAIKNKDKHDTEVSIVIGVDGQSIQIQSGKTLYDSALTAGNLYSFNTQDENANFQIKVYEGSANVFISENSRLLPQQYLLARQNITSNELIPVTNLKPKSKIFILVQSGSTQVNYSISAVDSSDNQKQLEIGQSQEGQLKPYSEDVFFYFSQGLKNPFTIFAQFSEPIGLSSRNYRSFVPKIQLNFSSNTNKQNGSELIQPIEIFEGETHTQVYYFLEKTDGYYLVSIKNDASFQIDYRLILNSYDINQMLPNQGAIYKSQVGGDPTMFQLFVKNTQRLYLEIFECLGDIVLDIGDNSTSTGINKIDHQQNYALPYNSTSGDLLFSIEAKSGFTHPDLNGVEQEAEALYYIVPHLLPSVAQLPTDVFEVGSDGRLKLQLNSDNDVVIQFTSLACKQDKCVYQGLAYPKMIIYTLHLTNNKIYLESFSSCNLEINTVKDYKVDLGKTQDAILHQKYFKIVKNNENNLTESQIIMTIDTSDLNQESQYQLKLQAKVYFSDDSEPFTFQYFPTEFTIKSMERTTIPDKSNEKDLQSTESLEEVQIEDQSTFLDQKVFGYDMIVVMIVGGSIFSLLILLVITRYCWLKFRKTKFKQANTRVRYEEEEQDK